MAIVAERSAGTHRAGLPGRTLGLRAASPRSLIREVELGFSFSRLRCLASQSGLPVVRIAAIIGIPERTLARRRNADRLTPDESERLLRISGVFEKAVDLFEGNRSAALRWLSSPKKALENETPLLYSRTELGAREVENLIGRLEHGVFA